LNDAASESLNDVATRLVARTRTTRVTGLRGAARAVAVAHLARAHADRPVLVIVPTAKDGDAFFADLACALGIADDSGRLRPFPRYDTQPYFAQLRAEFAELVLQGQAFRVEQRHR
jgi:hypothetical protein